VARHAQPIRIDIDDRDMLKKFAQFKSETAEVIRQSMIRAMQLVGLTAVEKYMVRARLLDYGTGKTIGIKGSKLNIRTSRLSRSLVGGFSFTQGLTGEQESIREIVVTGNSYYGLFGTKVPYAAIHEYGGETHPKITPRARGFFWGMYKRTRVPMWKWMALSKKTSFNIKIPARPFLNPALQDNEKKIEALFEENMRKLSRKVSDG